MSEPIKKISITGGDEHAWSAAARCLVGLQGQHLEITVIDDGSASTTPAVLSLDASAHHFHRSIGIQEASLVKNIGGCYRYGTRYKSAGGEFTFTYSPVGELINRVHFHQYVARLKNLGGDVDFFSHSLAAQAASQGRFSHPQADTALDKLDYMINVDRLRYVHLLRSAVLEAKAPNVQVSHRQSQITDVQQELQSSGSHSPITSLTLDNDELLATDFVIDCSGLLADQEFESWQSVLPFDKRLSWVQESTEETPVLNQFTELEHAALQRISLPGGHFYQLVFNSSVFDEQQAAELAEKHVGRFAPQLSELTSQRTGVVKHAWKHNVLSLGPQTAYAANHLFSDLYHTHTALERWLSLYPRAGEDAVAANAALAAEYNRQFHIEFEHVRDVHSLIFGGDGDADGDGGDQTAAHLETLSHRRDLFMGTGRSAFYESDVLEPHQWVQLMIGFGLWPKQTDPLINHLSLSQLEQQLQSQQSNVASVAAKMPKHDQLLQAIRNSA